MALPENLTALRKRCGLTQRELAQSAGLSERYVQYLEKGLRAPSLLAAVQLREVLGCTLDEMVDGLN